MENILKAESSLTPVCRNGTVDPKESSWTVWGDTGERRGLVRALRAGCQDLLSARALAWELFRRDFAAKYRESYLGYVWAFLPPLILALSMTLAGRAAILNVSTSRIPYALLVLVGTCLWQTFAESLLGPIQAVNQAKPLLTRIRFPHEAILLAKLAEVGFNTILRLLLVAGMMAYYQLAPSVTILYGLIGVLALMVLGSAMGTVLAPIGGIYNDVTQGTTVALAFWMLLTPVIYETARPGSLVERLNVINPVTPLLVSTREWLTGGSTGNLTAFVVVLLGSILLWLAAWLFWRFAMSFAIERAGA